MRQRTKPSGRKGRAARDAAGATDASTPVPVPPTLGLAHADADADALAPAPCAPRGHELAAALLGTLCFVTSVQGAFVFDDKQAVVENPDVRAPLGSVPMSRLFRHDFWGSVSALAKRWQSSHCREDYDLSYEACV